MHPFWLSDDAWAVIEPHLPHTGSGQLGRPRLDDRRIVSGILHVLRMKCYWRDLPQQYGSYSTVFNQYNRWRKRGVWQSVYDIIMSMESVTVMNAPGSRVLPREPSRAEVPYVVNFQI